MSGYSVEDIIKIKRFNQSIIDNPLPFDKQKIERDGDRVWCKDWEIIEICKYIFNGHEGYMGDPPPNRLKNNPLWSKNNIINEALKIMSVGDGSIDTIIQTLKVRRENNE